MLSGGTVSGSDQDVTVWAAGEVIVKIEGWIIRIIEQEKPLLLLPSKPIKCVFIAYAFGESDGSEVCVDCFGCGGINEIDVQEPRKAGELVQECRCN